MEHEFSPISHKERELLNETLAEANRLIRGTNEEKLTAILIFVNHIEYISEHLLRNLRRITKTATYGKFNGVIFWPRKEKIGPLTLGQTISALEQFNFPDEEDFILQLKQFNRQRNDFIHRLLHNIEVKDKKIESVLTNFDNIFVRYKSITKELAEKWPKELKGHVG